MVTLKSILNDLKEENIDNVVEAGRRRRKERTAVRLTATPIPENNDVNNSNNCSWYCCKGQWFYRRR